MEVVGGSSSHLINAMEALNEDHSDIPSSFWRKVLAKEHWSLERVFILFTIYNHEILWFCRYGVGYHLTLVKKESYDQEAITSLVKRHVPTAEIISCVGAEIQFVLSSESSQSFEALFYELESK